MSKDRGFTARFDKIFYLFYSFPLCPIFTRISALGHRRLAALRSFSGFLFNRGWLTKALLEGVERKLERKAEARALDTQKVEAVLRGIENPRDRALFWLIYDGGLRCQEALAIDIDDISWSDRSILLHGKGGRSREMFFSRTVGTLLDKYLATRGSPTSGPLFVTHRKARLPRRADLTADGYARLSYRQADTLWKAYPPEWDLHQLRHTAISVRAAHGYTEVDLKRFSGHTSLRSLERYIADNREAAKRKAREWERRQDEKGCTMPRIDETAYRQLKATPTDRELRELYTPTLDERLLAQHHTTGKPALVAFLVLLKTFQHLGYAVPLTSVPMLIVSHIADQMQYSVTGADLINYDLSGTRRRHLQMIRAHLQINADGVAMRASMEQAMREACESKDDLIDLINIAIEQLIRQCYELPAFSTFERTARRIRAESASALHTQVVEQLTRQEQEAIDRLFVVDLETEESTWMALKADPKNPTLSHFEEVMERATWLMALPISTNALAHLPDVKIQRFATEALALDAHRMREIQVRKRWTLALSLLRVQRAQALDDIAEMFCKRLLKIQHQGQEAFELSQKAARERLTRLVEALRDVTQAYEKDGTINERMEAIDAVYGGNSAKILADCEAQLALMTNTYFPFLRVFVSRHRASLFRFLSTVTLRSPHQNKALEETIQFLQANEHRSGQYLRTTKVEHHRGKPKQMIPLVDLSWMSDTWRRIVTGQSRRALHPERVHRQHFEACVFTQILWDLKTGDLYAEGSDRYANTWAQGISWEEYTASVGEYGEMLGFPVDGPGFVAHLKTWLSTIAQEVDQVFPNSRVTIDHGEPVIHKSARRNAPAGLKKLEKLLASKLQDVHLLEIMAHVQHWLNWCGCFGPLSGLETKLEDATLRQMLTVFAYGTQMGPAQMARSFAGITSRNLSWIHHEHISEEKLDAAITRVINGYTRFDLPRRWGSSKRASADGTKWEVHTHNLLAEYHIRYGGYGGIGYYHVSDTYIALFSRFIPCGVHEAIYILDGLLKNESEIKPEEVTGDTQAQNVVVFGLAHLLGIRLMPRIRNWKDLTLYRPTPESHYKHINALFGGDVNWDLIETHLPDLLRIVLSVKNGTITASTILDKLNTYSHKNKLYQAFRELGRVIRTGFLLQYLGDPELRAIIQRETNKSESFNGFAKWLAFGNGGVIPTNNRREMRKYLKYNHLLANIVIFANVALLTQAMNELVSEGHRIDPEAVAFLSPYITQHLVRFGLYQVDHTRPPSPLTYEVAIPNPGEALEEVSEAVSADEKTALSKWPKFVRIVVVPQKE